MFRLLHSRGDQRLPDFLGIERHVNAVNVVFSQGIMDGVDDGGRPGDRTDFPGALCPQGIGEAGNALEKAPRKGGQVEFLASTIKLTAKPGRFQVRSVSAFFMETCSDFFSGRGSVRREKS